MTLKFTRCSSDRMTYVGSLLTTVLYYLHGDVFRCNCGQAENESRASVYSTVITEKGSCSHLGLTSTANVLFVKLLYFRAVLLLGNLSDIVFTKRETTDFPSLFSSDL